MDEHPMQVHAGPALDDDDGLKGARGILSAIVASVAFCALLWLAMAAGTA
jgi:hypothetical protein